MASADKVVKTMIDHMTNPDSQSHLPLKSGPPSLVSYFSIHVDFLNVCSLLYLNTVFLFYTGDSVVVCVNNLGALSCLEMAVVTRAAIICLGNYGYIYSSTIIYKHLLKTYRRLRTVNGCFYDYRESRGGGRQGDVRVIHDITGDGWCVADPDEGQPGNTKTVW